MIKRYMTQWYHHHYTRYGSLSKYVSVENPQVITINLCLYHWIFEILTLGPKSPKLLLRVLLNAFNHHYYVTPFHGIASWFRVVFKQLEPTCLQPFDVHHHAIVFRMNLFYGPAAGPDKDEHVTILTLLFIFSCTSPHSELMPVCISVLPLQRKCNKQI